MHQVGPDLRGATIANVAAGGTGAGPADSRAAAWIAIALGCDPTSLALPIVKSVGRSRRQSTVDDVHRLAQAMPHVSVVVGRSGNRIYQVGRKSFVFFRTPRTDAFDPETGERYDDGPGLVAQCGSTSPVVLCDGARGTRLLEIY